MAIVTLKNGCHPWLLNMLTKDEVLDLVAYVLSGGDAENAMFKK